MTVVNLADRKKWEVDFLELESDDGGRTAPFMARLPAGKYAVGKWALNFMNVQFFADSDRQAVQFEVVAGQVTCIGSLHPIRRGPWREGEAPQIDRAAILLLPRADCPKITAMLQSRAPKLRVPVKTRLAVNPACPACRADASYASKYLTTHLVNLADVPVSRAEGLRDSPLFPQQIRWPKALTAAHASILMKICVSAAGAVQSVRLLEAAHPLLDAQVVEAARSWRYRPLVHEGAPTPFCYRRGLTFDHPAPAPPAGN